MKLLAMALCIACVPMLAQNAGQRVQDMTFRPASLVGLQSRQIATAINEHRVFELPNSSFGSTVTATARGIEDDGYTLTLTGVEIRAANLIVSAEQVIYSWASHQIELRGNVRLTPAVPQ